MRKKSKRNAPSVSGPSEVKGWGNLHDYRSRERDEDRQTRKRLALWDRVKILMLLVGAWLFLLWATIAGFPDGYLPLGDALNMNLRENGWLLVLAGLEFVRQIHYFISERSARYHRFWSMRFFGSFDRRARRWDAWTRYRIARVMKLLFFLLVLDLVIAKLFDLNPATALFELPTIIVSGLPYLLQLVFYFFIIIFQFVGIFWFLSRGGVDVYFPDDIRTRFTDVWGQDSVLGKIKENMVFLEDPESIEERGGYVPGGILLWGPPGTGKTLIAESVAGETGRPFVFVDPGAFINMFMGVGILKVKGLFRKLRRLAVRYGGVIVFFDEADSLGNRGQIAQGGLAGGAWSNDTHAGCHGMSYLNPTTAWQVHQWHLRDEVANQPRPGVADRIFF